MGIVNMATASRIETRRCSLLQGSNRIQVQPCSRTSSVAEVQQCSSTSSVAEQVAHAEKLLMRGRQLEREGKLDQAVSVLEQVKELPCGTTKFHIETSIAIAYVLAQQGAYPESLAQWSEARDLALVRLLDSEGDEKEWETYTTTFTQASVVYLQMARFDEAEWQAAEARHLTRGALGVLHRASA